MCRAAELVGSCTVGSIVRYTPNSSQLEPSENQNLHTRGAKRYRQVQSTCKKPFNFLNTTAQSPNNNKTTWLELVWVDWGGQTVENLTQTYPTPSKLWTWLELGGPFGQGLSCGKRCLYVNGRCWTDSSPVIRISLPDHISVDKGHTRGWHASVHMYLDKFGNANLLSVFKDFRVRQT